MGAKVRRLHPDMDLLFDSFNDKIKEDMNLDKVNSQFGSKVMADTLKEMGFPEGVKIKPISEPKKRRKSFDLRIEIP